MLVLGDDGQSMKVQDDGVGIFLGEVYLRHLPMSETMPSMSSTFSSVGAKRA